MSIRSVSTEALECRDNTCQWEHYRPLDSQHPRYWGTYRHDRCVNCGNVRRRIENSDGSIAPGTTKYEYTDDYRAALRYPREDARLELNRRARADKGKDSKVLRGKRGSRNLRVVV